MSPTPQERAAEQRKQVWSGCQSVLGCGGLIALIAFCYVVIGWLPKSVKAAPDVIVFIDARLVQNTLFWSALFGLAILFGGLARVKSKRGALVVIGVCLLGVSCLIYGLYARVAAIAFSSQVIELRYVWPRPATKLQPQDVLSTDWEQGSRLINDSSEPEYILHIHTQHSHYISFAHLNFDDLERAQQRIKALQQH